MATFRAFLLLVFSIQFLLWNAGTAAAARHGTNEAGGQTHIPVHIGVVLNLNSTMDTMADVCISMAREDFYSVHSDYQTRLILHTKDVQGELDVVIQVLELLNNEDVHGIIGPQTLTEDTFAAELGRKAQVPLIFFTSRTQSRSHDRNPYLIRTAPDKSNQVKALATICMGFGWQEVVILCEDTNCGNEFTSELNREFLRADIRLVYMTAISASAANHHIRKELENLTTIQARVFIVHMNPDLGGRLFILAKNAGMMSEGYAWLVADSLGNFLNSIDSTALDSMEGVLGIRPPVPKSEKLESFEERWKKNMILTKSASIKVGLNVYGLWAYDAIWALAMAVEKIKPENSSLLKVKNGENDQSGIFNLKISQFGPELLIELHNTTFHGLLGKFQLIDGQLKPSALEIFNVFGTGDKIVGYWTPDRGITRDLASSSDKPYSTSTKVLKTIVWPGDSPKKPIGWSIPESGKLKVVIPKKIGFTEFVHVTTDPVSNKISDPTGFSIDIFNATVQYLPFEVDPVFLAIDANGSSGYDHLLDCLGNKSCDMVVGDVTGLEYRARSVDFSLPYSESGVVWVVKNKQGRHMWIFIKPFRWDPWATILGTWILIGGVLRILERQANHNSSNSIRPRRQQLGLLFWFPIAVLAFPERNMVANKWSRFVLVVWLFMSYILMQSYTANLSAMFTVDQLDFTFSQDYYIGHQQGTFVEKYLINHHNISESKLKGYSTIEEFDDAMMKGSKNGGIDAIVDESPYMKLFLSRYGSKYKMLPQRYRTEGFSFAFPRNSLLTSHFSRAILNVTESPNMSRIEEKNFGPGYSSQNQLDSISKQTSLTTYNFGGLFIFTVSAVILALLSSVGQKLIDSARTYCFKCFSLLPLVGKYFRTADSMVHPSEGNVELSGQITVNDTAIPAMDHQLCQGNSDVLAEVEEFDQSSCNSDIQQPQPANADESIRDD